MHFLSMVLTWSCEKKIIGRNDRNKSFRRLIICLIYTFIFHVTQRIQYYLMRKLLL